MEDKLPSYKLKNEDLRKKTATKHTPKEAMKKAKGDCEVSESTSHTKFFKKDRYEDLYSRITRDQYFGKEESITGSSDSFHCVHGPEGKQYSEKGKLKRNILKELDPHPVDCEWNDGCPPAYDWEMAQKLEFLVTDVLALQQLDRLNAHLKDYARTSSEGYVSLEITIKVQPHYFLHYKVKLNSYLLLRLEEDDLFELVSMAVRWQLSAPDSKRAAGAVQMRPALAAAAPVVSQSIVRMLAVCSAYRFPTFLDIAFFLACDSVENCVMLMKENILENIFYRFNPYFPGKKLPAYDINPADPQDFNVQLGESSVHMSTTLSLLLVLVTTLKQCTDENLSFPNSLPCPDSYALRCFVWTYRYECRARDHRHQRITLTVIASALAKCFGERLVTFATSLMPDVMSLSVLTELPFRVGWIEGVNFNTSQLDVQFKKVLIYLSIDLLKIFPYNSFLVESQCWLLGLMCLLDPGLSHLQARWSPALFAELRTTALQALVCALPRIPARLAKDYSLIRRIMWYIEWYSESPYELPVLYWSVRVLQVAFYSRGDPARATAVKDLFDTHGIIIMMHLCKTLLQHQSPPVEKRQVIIALALRLLTSSFERGAPTTCCVYPEIKWPSSIPTLAKRMLDTVLQSLDRNCNISDRWLISLLNFIWEGIIWKQGYRQVFLAHDGVYKLLDLITLTRAPVQCIALALVCDAARAGAAVGQLVSWRASIAASNANPLVVKRGSTIASLLAAIFRDECQRIGVRLNENGIIQDLDNPLRSADVREAVNDPDFQTGKHDRTAVCYAAAELAGSRLSKAFALLHMLSEDLNFKVLVTDETYNLYKHIKLTPQDEAILVLCSHYLTEKLNEAWSEIEIQCQDLEPQDKDILEEFLHISKGWAVEIKQQQEAIIEADRKKKHEEENSLYEFLGRVRLNMALDALREVRCVARASDRARVTHAMLFDAVHAHNRRAARARELGAPVLRTYGPSLDDHNITGQYVKVYSIHPKNKPKPMVMDHSSSTL
ncbi:hypothetical protein MSG28_000850 [Choristoneura fumiferana]|uniref:Uncharacterized protein n=1 Tax=Choristoneura fumiferana TaxID=7141 RepID=A0ACC0K2P7_CHOFU|nr:hypothetical protein MSG28_000850 [Choristoneura fumiferana]